MRLLWSPSQRFTAEMFLKLKEGRHEPDQKSAMQINGEDVERDEANDAEHGASDRRTPRTNTSAFDVLRKLPGVTPRNMFALARRAKSMAGLTKMALDTLTEVLGA